jgi:hypothetical protein
MWAEVSSSIPHRLHIGLSASPSRWKCLLRELCPVSIPVTTLAWALVKDKILALILLLKIIMYFFFKFNFLSGNKIAST